MSLSSINPYQKNQTFILIAYHERKIKLLLHYVSLRHRIIKGPCGIIEFIASKEFFQIIILKIVKNAICYKMDKDVPYRVFA